MSAKPSSPIAESSPTAEPNQSASTITESVVTNEPPTEVESGANPGGNSLSGEIPPGTSETPGVDNPPSGESPERVSDTATETAAPDPVKRASRLRNAENISPEDKAWLAEYEANKRPRGRPKKEAEPTPTPAPAAKPTVAAPPSVVQSVQRGKVRSPPPVLHAEKAWRGKYDEGITDGREMLCVFGAEKWHKFLIGMSAQLKEAGIDPIVDVDNDATRRMLIIALDDMLPPSVKATPAILASFSTTALITQRVAKRGAIADAMERKKRPQVVRMPPQPMPEPAPVAKREEPPRRDRPDVGPNSDGKFVIR